MSINALESEARLTAALSRRGQRIIACSGGIDSLLLSTLAHRLAPELTLIAHAVSPAVPAAATARVIDWAEQEGWNLKLVRSGEFENEDYLSNPVNRCFHCKSQLYASLQKITNSFESDAAFVKSANNQDAELETILMSGANTDDLGEYRPGLIAADNFRVQHPYIDANISKAEIRAIATRLSLPFATLPASPCLASRLYTGTRVTEGKLLAVDASESAIREATHIETVRCRIRDKQMYVEVKDTDREKISPNLLAEAARIARQHFPELSDVCLDAAAYRPGRAFLIAKQ